MVDVQRRQFFSHFLQQAKKANSTPRTVPRPPTAVSEDEFIERCDGCGLCAEHCPNHIITIANDLAQLDLELSSCSHCSQCKIVCSTGALNSPVSDCLLRPTVTSTCNPHMAMYCAECRDSCPTLAITIEPNQPPSIDAVRCNGCNLCRTQCPTSAIEMSIVQKL
ncbi:ferredoxin-type protein NapF [Vibrio xiamenensis]|uniref:Ferredoxin-type protein NapF n=1 Tax=Vibrio xiamenensis TaxID=861298 RepID=A0A1G8F3E9_9VIBR|nr:4Fe-4S binding protein [Vibrio xiamenensis]SDH76675.1 ferredoxin-type protein NapF [Vibrio xiamenensis]